MHFESDMLTEETLGLTVSTHLNENRMSQEFADFTSPPSDKTL